MPVSVDPNICANDVRMEISDNDLEINLDFPNWVSYINYHSCVCMISPV